MTKVITVTGSPMDNSIKAAAAAGNLDILTRLLADLLDGSYYISDDGSLVRGRQQVARIDGMVVSIYGREEGVPHFHVHGRGVDCRFTIRECRCMDDIDASKRHLVEYWYQRGRQLLIKTWNETRPDNCTVGRYRE